MDKHYITQRLKKYLFLISIIFVILTSTHLIYSYIYSDAKETAIKWWSVSEAIIGKVPNLNPLKNNSDQNKYINTILYRSLLKYDISKKKIVWDLTKCDISNLLTIECFLNENLKWSNWEDITYDDIIKTFEVLKSNEINPIMSSLLKTTTIKQTKTSIIFKNTKKDINFLKVFFQPIVSSKILNVISKKEIEWSFSLPNGIYSWKYKVSNITKDETAWITTISLERNDQYYKNPVYIDTILFKVFPTIKDFLRNKGSINIFNDKDNLISWTIPRLQEHNYILPQYVSVFLNTARIKSNDLRSLILDIINREDLVKELGTTKFKTVNNHFISNNYVASSTSKETFKSILAKKWYYSLDIIISKLETQLSDIKNGKIISLISWEAQVKLISNEVKIPQKKIKKIDNPKSKLITSPTWVDKYNFISKNNILLEWKVHQWISAVYINDYQLKWYTAWSRTFRYRISTQRNTLKEWNNNYKIYFQKNWKKELVDEVNFFHSNDKSLLKKKEKEALERVVSIKKESPQNIKIPFNSQKKAKVWTGTTTNKQIELEKKIIKAKELNKEYIYNEDLENYSLELYFLSWKADYKKTAEIIQQKLKEKGIKIELREISTQNLNSLLLSKRKNYDILLAGVNLSYFKFNIYPYFHSSQIESGYNFSNYRKLDLDIILEELKSKLLSEDKVNLLQKKALKIINDNYLAKTIYTPILSNLVDKNIKSYSLEQDIPENIYRFEPLQKSFVNEEKKIITENKWVIWYIKFLFETLF